MCNFLSFFNNKIIKSTKIIITIITPIIVVIMLLGFGTRAKTSFLMSKKNCTTRLNWGEGGGGNLGNARKKSIFFCEVFPYSAGLPLKEPTGLHLIRLQHGHHHPRRTGEGDVMWIKVPDVSADAFFHIIPSKHKLSQEKMTELSDSGGVPEGPRGGIKVGVQRESCSE